MKFGAKFQSYTVPEWQEHYVDYQCLKALLKQQKRRLAAVDAPGYLAKFFPTRWHPNADKAPDSVGIASGLPLQAAASAFGSGVAEEKTQHSSNGSAQRLEILKNVATTNSIPLAGSYQESPDAVKQPLLQSPQWQREGCQIGVTSPAEGQQGGSSARKLEALRVECVEAFRAAVEKEKTKVAAFFKDELGFLEDKLHAVSTELKAFSAARRRRALTKNAEGSARTRATCLEKTASTTHSKSGLSSSALAGVGEAEETALSSQDAAYLRRLERILLLLLDTLDKLEVYRRLNLLAFWKALKKRDKQLQLSNGQAAKDFETITAFFSEQLRIPPKTRVRQLPFEFNMAPFCSSSSIFVEGAFSQVHLSRFSLYPKLSPSVFSFPIRSARALYRQVAGEDSELSLDVLPLRTAEGLSVANSYFLQAARVWFLAGCLAVLLLVAIALLLVPASHTEAFDYDGLMTVFPLFRLAFALSFLWFATASAMAVMERYGVNYRFLLDLAPRGKASSISFFATAALHFVVTTATCVLYLADARLRLMGGSQMARRQVLAELYTVLKAGLIPDAYALYAVQSCCPLPLSLFLLAGRPQSRPPSTPPASRSALLSASLPVLHKVSMRRGGLWMYTLDEHGEIRLRHPGVDYYKCSMVRGGSCIKKALLDWGVSVYAMCLLWVFSYCLGSLFMLYWDVRVDWGLLPTPDRFIRSRVRETCLQPEDFSLRFCHHEAETAAVAFRPMQGRLMYPAWMYGAIAVTNAVQLPNGVLLQMATSSTAALHKAMGRLTWAMTLMPISFVGNKSLSGNLVLLFISVVEILRRGAWVVLRLENEHVNNSSRFRAILWVPPLHQTRLEMLEGDPLIQANSPSSFAQTKGASARGGQQHELSGFSSNVSTAKRISLQSPRDPFQQSNILQNFAGAWTKMPLEVLQRLPELNFEGARITESSGKANLERREPVTPLPYLHNGSDHSGVLMEVTPLSHAEEVVIVDEQETPAALCGSPAAAAKRRALENAGKSRLQHPLDRPSESRNTQKTSILRPEDRVLDVRRLDFGQISTRSRGKLMSETEAEHASYLPAVVGCQALWGGTFKESPDWLPLPDTGVNAKGEKVEWLRHALYGVGTYLDVERTDEYVECIKALSRLRRERTYGKDENTREKFLKRQEWRFWSKGVGGSRFFTKRVVLPKFSRQAVFGSIREMRGMLAQEGSNPPNQCTSKVVQSLREQIIQCMEGRQNFIAIEKCDATHTVQLAEEEHRLCQGLEAQETSQHFRAVARLGNYDALPTATILGPPYGGVLRPAGELAMMQMIHDRLRDLKGPPRQSYAFRIENLGYIGEWEARQDKAEAAAVKGSTERDTGPELEEYQDCIAGEGREISWQPRSRPLTSLDEIHNYVQKTMNKLASCSTIREAEQIEREFRMNDPDIRMDSCSTIEPDSPELDAMDYRSEYSMMNDANGSASMLGVWCKAAALE
ncbi:spx domain-containing protein [Cyclospora cayetanensis]|uniref:Spx domain-containing protein n=1 Tax=Cyclospora cayetanensis TaxID=88456 RepID=A0A1D3D9Y7_9EIME|nr:spx domain-containing protein [Cyclospora cayetanensis]